MIQGGIAAAFPSYAGRLNPSQHAVISYRILETACLWKPPNEKNQTSVELRGEPEHLYASHDSQR